MKWVKVAIGAVIALAVIPLIVGVVGEVSKPDTFDSIEFEIISDTEITEGTYNKLKLVTRDSDSEILDWNVDLFVNTNLVQKTYNLILDTNSMTIHYNINVEDLFFLIINNDDSISTIDYVFEIGDIVTIKLNQPALKPSVLSPSLITLIALTPLIFVGGVMSYFLVKTNLKKED